MKVKSILPGALAQRTLADTAVIVCGRYELLKETPSLLKAVCSGRMESQAGILGAHEV